MKKYEGKVAIVTGAASGIGRALSEKLARQGANVTLTDVNSDLLREATASITASGGSAKSSVLDVSDRNAVEKLIKDTVSEHGRLDYLFNNAGIAVGGEARDLGYDDWKKVIDVNLYGVVNGVFVAYPIMVEQGFGHIVNTASLAGLFPFGGEIAYSASKHGVVGLSHALRAEGADLGVKVSVVRPGKINTPIYDTSKMIRLDRKKAFEAFPQGISPKECATIILRGVERNQATIPVTRLAKILWMLGRASPAAANWTAKQYVRKMRTARTAD